MLKKLDKIAYELKLHRELSSVHSAFYVSMLKKCICDLESVLPIYGLGVKYNLSREEVSIQIHSRKVKKIRKKEVASVKVLWKNHLLEGATWEVEADMKFLYPQLFDN